MAGAIDRRSLMLAMAGLPAATGARAGDGPVVEIADGALRGIHDRGVSLYAGIPYAAPPVGPLRYRSPRPPAPWGRSVRDATKPGPASIQTLGGAAAWLYDGAEPQGEDCLYLNVWTPAPGGRRPVMVWFHGGAWRTGHGFVAGTQGGRLAADGDVVVVTVNYRLGALGWLAHPALADPETGAFANWGHQDQVAALRWVKANIAAFGGDPGNVTLFGQSAGGQSVAAIAQNPANAGLFHRAIVQSGSLYGAPAFPEVPVAAAYAEALAKRLGRGVGDLAAVPAQDLHAAELQLGRDPATARTLGRPPILPVRDGRVLTAWPHQAPFPAIPLMIGTTRDEAAFWFDLVGPDGLVVSGSTAPGNDEGLASLAAELVATYRPEAAAIPIAGLVAAYRQAALQRGEAADPKTLWLALHTDVVFRLNALGVARRHAAAGHPTFLYEFQRPLLPPGRGVPHTAEVPFVFGTHGHPFFARKLGAGPEAEILSRSMRLAWARFAYGETPAAEGLGRWQAMARDGRGITLLGGPAGPLATAEAVRPAEAAAWGL